MKLIYYSIRSFFIGTIFLLFFTVSCGKGTVIAVGEPQAQSELLLGTVCKITIYDYPSDAAFKAAFKRIKEIEDRMSIRIQTSEISKVNAMAGIGPVVVSADTFAVVEQALLSAAQSRGAFDPTVGPLVQAWDIGGDNARRPPQAEIDSLLPLVGYNRVVLDAAKSSIFLKDPHMVLDLGGIAKGYAADEVAEVLISQGVRSAIINLGGNVLTLGSKPDGSAWKIGIQNPEVERGGYLLIVQFTDMSLVTSGPYERFLELDGVVYHHILDTKTGYPVDSDFTSVSIITPKSFLADALSTAVYSLGFAKGMELVNSLEGVEAVFINNLREVYLSQGLLEGKIPVALTNQDYTIVR
jgi:thiamine biosynthesis lipoprotein